MLHKSSLKCNTVTQCFQISKDLNGVDLPLKFENR